MNFEEYLISKKIDAHAFQMAEPALWNTWKSEFDQMHPNSFTAQKLYLINPLRRRFLLKEEPKPVKHVPAAPENAIAGTGTVNNDASAPAPPPSDAPMTPAASPAKPATPKPAIPRPVFKPKPKTS